MVGETELGQVRMVDQVGAKQVPCLDRQPTSIRFRDGLLVAARPGTPDENTFWMEADSSSTSVDDKSMASVGSGWM
jgi:hypothetical protein